MKQALEKSVPTTEHFDHDLNETLMKIRGVDADDENEFITISENDSVITPSELSRALKARKVKPITASFSPSCRK